MADMMRVALFTPNLGGGGAERVMANLANALCGQFDIDYVAGEAVGSNRTRLDERITVVDLGSDSMSAAVLPLRRYIRDRRPSVIISALGHANVAAIMAGLLSGTNVKVVATVHNNMSSAASHDPDLKGRLLPLIEGRLYRLAHSVVAVSNGVADDFSKVAGFPREQIRVIYNPVIDPSIYLRAAETPAHKWLHDHKVPVLINVGRLVPQKDQRCLIRAMERVLRVQPARLLILGDGPERGSLLTLATELGIRDAVEIVAFQNNPYPYIRSASVFVLSSAWEGLPTVLIEAMALEVPIVSTDCPSGPREILESGRYGALVPVGRDDLLADAILRALKHTRQELPISVERYTVSYAADMYRDAILASGRDGGAA